MMKTFTIHEASLQLSRLLERVRQTGEPFLIAKAGRPIAKVIAVDTPEPASPRRLGFLAGEIEVPEDFDRMGEAETDRLFGAGDDPAA